ncbi:MAG TPA: hypothetical protein VK253_05455 [Candidatus Binatia bacterium]|nr:hypothetical protein [Candidatus Binatia bacterium]
MTPRQGDENMMLQSFCSRPDFALLYGSSSVISLTALLCMRAQLPIQLGGLGSNVVFIDGGNTFGFCSIAPV